MTSYIGNAKSSKLDEVRLGPPPKRHPLAADVKLVALAGENLAIFWHKGRRYVGEKGQPISNEAGEAVPELAGWVFSVLGGDHAALSNEKERASVVMMRQPAP